jgi:hypothetical protein
MPLFNITNLTNTTATHLLCTIVHHMTTSYTCSFTFTYNKLTSTGGERCVSCWLLAITYMYACLLVWLSAESLIIHDTHTTAAERATPARHAPMSNDEHSIMIAHSPSDTPIYIYHDMIKEQGVLASYMYTLFQQAINWRCMMDGQFILLFLVP